MAPLFRNELVGIHFMNDILVKRHFASIKTLSSNRKLIEILASNENHHVSRVTYLLNNNKADLGTILYKNQ